MNDNTRKELVQFFIITFIFSWLFWLPGVLAYFGVIDAPAGLLKVLEVAGAIGPAVVALILSPGWQAKRACGRCCEAPSM
jgi:hypothetical protein